MKVLKKARQKNVELNKDYYNEVQIKTLIDFEDVCFFNEDFKVCCSYKEYVAEFCKPSLILFLEDNDKLEVQLNEYGHYTNVLVKSNGAKYFVIL